MPKESEVLTQLEFREGDFALAEELAQRLGYEQTAYTSTSALWGLYCIGENPATWTGPKQALTDGCIVRTRELGLIFVQILENLAPDLNERQRKVRR